MSKLVQYFAILGGLKVCFQKCNFKIPQENVWNFKFFYRHYTVTEQIPDKKPRRIYMNEQISYISNIVSESKIYSSKEWENIFNQVFSKGFYVTPENITPIILGICTSHKQFTVATSLLNFLTESKTKLNIATLSKYLRLCYETWPECGENTILKCYDQLCSKVPILDANTSENVILALSKTSQWQKAYEHLISMKVTCSPGTVVYSALISAAFNNGDFIAGWNLAQEAVNGGRKPKPDIYLAWLNYCRNHNYSLESVEIMLNYLSKNDIAVPLSIAKELQNCTENIPYNNWKGKLGEVNDRGICSSCGKQLQPIQLTDRQFKTLSESFLKSVVLGRDVFTKSTPSEITAFQTFLKESYPYDIVIDGLNVAYSTGATGKFSSQIQSRALRGVLEQFVNGGKEVMVIGRKHMLSWPKVDISYIKRNSRLFLANDLTHDDPLLLYAALYGGAKTYFVSKDLMRGHAFRLGDIELTQLFRRWQQWRQYQVIVSKVTGKIRISPPMTFLPVAQKSSFAANQTTWHIPYQEIIDESAVILNVPYKWLCLQHSK